MIIHSTPNRNGNPPEHYKNHALQILKAATALQQALVSAKADICHGRNYQTVGKLEGHDMDIHDGSIISADPRDLDLFTFDELLRSTRDATELAAAINLASQR